MDKISNLFNKQPNMSMSNTTPNMITPKIPISSLYVPPVNKIKLGTVNPIHIPNAIRDLESSGGTDPNTPTNQARSYVIPAMNPNEKPRVVKYNTGYGGQYGLTPVALAELAKSRPNREAPTEQYTKYGPPLIPGKHPNEIQKALMTPEGAGQLANEIFLMKRKMKEDYTPEALTADYMDNYVGKGGPNYTPKNRARVLSYFKNIMEK